MKNCNLKLLFRISLVFAALLLSTTGLKAQLTGTKSIPADYASISAFVTDLNTQGVGPGGVTLDVPSGYTETAPAGGLAITATGTAANPIIIHGVGGAPQPIITASAALVAGNLNDALIKIIGGDYITIAGLDLRENAANTTTAVATNNMTEFGIALFITSATDGSQSNTLSGNTISLGSTYQNAIGIFSTSSSSQTNGALAATSVAGTNSSNKIYSNTINNVAYGIYMICEPITATIFETGNDIGGTSVATANNITYGNNTTSNLGFTRFSGAVTAGIYLRNAAGNSVRFNTITTVSGLTAPTSGITLVGGANPSGVTYNSVISDNTVNLTAVGTNAVIGIDFGGGVSTGTITSNNNTVTLNQNAAAATSGALTGIKVNYTSATNNVTNNAITINQNTSAGAITSTVIGVNAGGVGTTVNVTGNNVKFNQALPTGTGSYGSGAMTYINVSASSGTINTTGNTLSTLSSTVRSTGTLIGVNQDATVTALVNIKNNIMNVDRLGIGTSYFAFTSGSPSEVADTISNNTITFTGLNGTSSICAIQSHGGPGAGAIKSICNNVISITGTHTGVTLGLSIGYSTNSFFRGNTITINSASTAVNGIQFNTGALIETVSGNNININSSSTGTLALNGIVSTIPTTCTILSNTISIASTGGGAAIPTLQGIILNIGTGNIIQQNNIQSISAATGTGAVTINGIVVSGGTSTSILRNKIYNLQNGSSAGVVNGILVSAGTTTNVYNNLISQLSAPIASVADAIRGIAITSTTAASNINVYYNSVYLNASSTGTNFGTSGIFHTGSTTASTAALDLRNNIIINESAPAGTGVTVAFRRGTAAATDLASTSNRNMLYAGLSSATRLIYTDGTTPQQTLVNYASNVLPVGHDVNSFTGEAFSYSTPGSFFISLTGASTDFLKPVAGITTQVESGAANITSPAITTDYAAVIRAGNAGYAGTGNAPDVGAFEFNGTTPAPVVTLSSITPGTTSQCTATARVINVNVTAAAGTVSTVTLAYAVNGTPATPITMSFVSGTIWTGTIPVPTPANATITWAVAAQSSLGLNGSYTGTPYADEPLTGVTASATSSAATICSGSSSVLTAKLNRVANVLIGSGTSSNAANTSVGAFYGTWFGNAHSQVLITAAELTAAGLTAGNITALSINISALGTPATLNNFTVKIGATAATTITTFQSPTFTTVVTPANYTPVLGLNTHTFAAPFNWDGTSNIIVDYCFANSVTGSASAVNTMTTTAFGSFVYYAADNAAGAGACSNTTVLGTSSNRPNLILTGNTAPAIQTVSWSDGVTTVGTNNPLTVNPTATHTYTASITAAGCTVSPSPTTTVTVNPLPTAPTATNSAQCGVQVPTASVASTSGLPTPTFAWYSVSVGGTAIAGQTGTTYTNTIATTTTFYVSEINSVTGCESPRTAVNVNVSTPDPIAINHTPAAICIGQTVSFTVANTSGTPFQSYTYSTVSTTGSGAETPIAGASFTATPTAAGTYTYTATGVDGGCAASATTVIVVNALPAPTATATPTTVCSGDVITLTTGVFPPNGGTATLGTQTTTEFEGVYRNGFGAGDFRHQLLYTAAEMTAAGFTAGNISSLAFNVTSVGSGSANNYTIKLANSPATVLNATFQTGTFTTVYSAPTYTAVSGLNVHTFSTPFAWDGTSNILVDICYNISTIGGSSTVAATTPAAVSNANLKGTAGACSALAGATTYANRPLIRFTMNFNANYTWLWTPGGFTTPVATTSIVNNTGSAITQPFTVAVTNNTTGCSANIVTAPVTINPAVVAPIANNSTQCGPGVPPVSVTGSGTPGNTYAWYTVPTGGTAIAGQTGSTFTASISATTTYYVTELTGSCASPRTMVTATVTPAPAVTVSGPTAVCNGSSIPLTANSSNAGYTYTWSGGLGTGATVSASPTVNTVYTVSALDASGGANNGCNTTATYSITVNPVPSAVTASVNDNTICVGESVNLTSSATSNSAPVSTPLLTQNFDSGFGAWTATYSGTAPATTGWMAQTSPYSIVGSMTFTNFATPQGGGFAMANADLGSSGNKTRAVLTSPSFSTVGMTAATLTFQNLYQRYTNDSLVAVQASTDNGATWTTVKEYYSLGVSQGNVNNSAQVPANESIVLGAAFLNQANVKIRYNYVSAWGFYWLVDNVVVTGQQPAAANFSWTSSPAGFTSAVQNPPAVAPAVTTTYTVSASNSFGCSTTASATVTVNALPAVSAGADFAVCTGSTATLTGSGADNYVWTGGVTNNVAFTPATTATYTVTGTDVNGCVNTDAVQVTVNPLPTVSAGVDQTVCSGASVTLAGSGADNYVWTGGITDNTPFTITTTTTYTVTGTDVNGCTNTDAVIVNVNALPTVSAGVDQTVCSGASVTLAGSGANGYVWTGGVTNNTPFTATTTTTYNVTGTDVNGCTNTDAVIVNVNALPTVSAGVDQTVCSGDEITLTGSGADDYVWTGGVSDNTPFTITATTTYTVVGTDVNGCTNTDAVTVNVNALPTVNGGSDVTICTPGTQTTLTATGSATSYTWNNSVVNGVAFTPAVGVVDYIVIGVDANLCENSDTVTVGVSTPPTVNGGIDVTVCSGATVTLTATGTAGVDFDWNNGVTDNTPFIATTTTTYTVTAEDAAGCTTTDQVIVNVNALPTVNAGSDQTVCEGDMVTLTGSGTAGVNYSWNNGVTNNTPFAAVTTTTYTVTGTDANTCSSSDQVVVNVNAVPVAVATLSNNVTLTATAGASYQWINCTTGAAIAGATSQTFNATANGSYAVVVTNASDCSDTSSCISVTTVGIKENIGATIAVYPNPTHDNVTISMSAESATIEVVDAQGKLLQTVVVVNGGKVNLADYTPGVYFLKINTDKGSALERVVKN